MKTYNLVLERKAREYAERVTTVSGVGDILKEARERAEAAEHARAAADERIAVLLEVGKALFALLDRDVTYNGNFAMLPFESHDQAINHISEARSVAVIVIDAALAGQEPPAAPTAEDSK